MDGGKNIAVFLVVFCFYSVNVHAVIITEVMYAPADANEWVELYNNDSISVSLQGWFLEDGASRDTIECCVVLGNCSRSINQGGFALILDQDSSHFLLNSSNSSSVFCVDDNSIGNGLSDLSDRIQIGVRSGVDVSILDSMSYGGGVVSGRNYTLERDIAGEFRAGYDVGGTPLRPNSLWDITREYRGLVISEVLPDPEGVDTLRHPRGEWVELYNGAGHDIDLRDLRLVDLRGGVLLISPSRTFGSGVIICDGCYSVVYRNGDAHFSLNNNGDSVFLMVGDQVISTMNYTDSDSGVSFARVINVVSDDYGSDFVFVPMHPTPGRANVEEVSCEYGLSLETDSFIEDGSNYTFGVVVDHLDGVVARVNVSGVLYSEGREIVEEYFPFDSEVVRDSEIVEYSPRLDPGIYELNFSLSSGCNDSLISNNFDHQALIVLGEDDVGDEVGDFEYWDIIDITPSEVAAGGVVSVRVVGDVSQVSRFWMWVEDGSGRLTKEVDFTVEAGLFDIKLPFDLAEVCGRGGSTAVVMEGRGVELRTEFFVLESVCTAVTRSSISLKKSSSKSSSVQEKSFQGIVVPSIVSSGGSFEAALTFDSKEGDYDIWGYVYRGSACYSCGKKMFKPDTKKFVVHSSEKGELRVNVPVTLDEVEPGAYQVKVKVLRAGTKTPREFRSPIGVVKGDVGSLKSNLGVVGKGSVRSGMVDSGNEFTFGAESVLPVRIYEGESSGVIMYRGSNSSISEVVVFFLALGFGVLLVISVLRRSEM